MTETAIIGGGVVGSAWAIVFARAGHSVRIYDPNADAAVAVLTFAGETLPDLEAMGMSGGRAAGDIMSRMRLAPSLEAALDGVEHVQESAPERLAIKTELYAKMDALAQPNVVLASSSSGIPASAFTADLEHRSRCLVAHPINPPHLIPLVELVPAPWTEQAVVDRTEALMREIGQAPIRLRREINGFLVNRLQGAMLSEAFRLVEDGVCDASDIDDAVSEGLGLRWCFMGPFQTIDLNARTGIAEYCQNLGPLYYELAQEQADPRPWAEALVGTIEGQLREKNPAAELPGRRAWRDRFLAAMVAARMDARRDLGA